MEFTTFQLVLIYSTSIYFGPLAAARTISRYCSRQYKRQARALRLAIPLSRAAEQARQKREETNRQHRFLRLPAELRNRIYGLCMISDSVLDPVWGPMHGLEECGSEAESRLCRSWYSREYIDQTYSERPGSEHASTWARMANMSQVCRAWRSEALRHFYGSNCFKLPVGRLEARRGSTEQRRHALWPLCRPSDESREVRRYCTPGLRKRPKEAFAVMRLVLDGKRHCPHFVPQSRYRRGSSLVLVDFGKRTLRPVRGKDRNNIFDLWHCDSCWKQFVTDIASLHCNEEMGKLFADFGRKMDAKSAIRLINGLKGILEAEYD